MKIFLTSLISLFTLDLHAIQMCSEPWYCRIENRQVKTILFNESGIPSEYELNVAIRSGFLKESDQVPFRGNVIYYEGLGDSMVNHMPLFNKLTNAGYRVIAFDYMGQGGSQGSMNDTRVEAIPDLGNQIWKLYARDLKNFPKKTIIGWSTGGLAAYVQALSDEDKVDNVVLIAPGLVPNLFVGETNLWRLELNRISLPTLTTDVYSTQVENPHIEPIVPNSPVKVLNFAMNLLEVAAQNRHSIMRQRVKGLVLLSGPNDSYVDAKETKRMINQVAYHFSIKEYPEALHEIDNEKLAIREKAHQDILEFLNNNNP